MKAKDKCQTPYCRNDKPKEGRCCSKCRHRARKTEDPVKYSYFTLRDNAKRRRKFFDLTLEQFRGFVSENMYMELKGNTKNCLSIDRIEVSKGYTISNIRAITVSQNSKKRHQEYKGIGTADMYDHANDSEFYRTQLDKNDPNYLPF